jgi:hypothetical protein
MMDNTVLYLFCCSKGNEDLPLLGIILNQEIRRLSNQVTMTLNNSTAIALS